MNHKILLPLNFYCLQYLAPVTIYVGNSSLFIMLCIGTVEIHKPTEDTINPAYHTVITNYDYRNSLEEPVSYYEEVTKLPEVRMTQNPAYVVP